MPEIHQAPRREAETQLLPNIRELFIPDPGYLILDCDLKGADAQVVAWEADDEDLKDAFKSGINVHHKNGCDMMGEAFESLDPESFTYKKSYNEIKHGTHGFNYGGSARTLAITQGWTIEFSENFKRKWFQLHPGILTKFQGGIRRELETGRRVRNKFGFHRIYFDRIDNVFTQALAWKPQSTIALTAFRGGLQVREHLSWVEILLQNHDSWVFQVPKSRQRDIQLLNRHLRNTIPYEDPLVVPWEVGISDRSWGHCKKTTWEEIANVRF